MMHVRSRIITAALVLLIGILNSLAHAAEASTPLEEMYRSLAARRIEQIERLHIYSDRAVFPRNTDFPGRRVPYFVDRTGTHCAVGHLVHLRRAG